MDTLELVKGDKGTIIREMKDGSGPVVLFHGGRLIPNEVPDRLRTPWVLEHIGTSRRAFVKNKREGSEAQIEVIAGRDRWEVATVPVAQALDIIDASETEILSSPHRYGSETLHDKMDKIVDYDGHLIRLERLSKEAKQVSPTGEMVPNEKLQSELSIKMIEWRYGKPRQAKEQSDTGKPMSYEEMIEMFRRTPGSADSIHRLSDILKNKS